MAVLIHIGVRSSDLGRALQFWRDGLGWQVARELPGRVDLTDGLHNIAVLQYHGPGRPPHIGGMDDYLHVGVGVPDVPATARRLRDMGYTIFSDGLSGKQPLDPDHLEQPAFKVEDPDSIIVDVVGVAATWPGVAIEFAAAADGANGAAAQAARTETQ